MPFNFLQYLLPTLKHVASDSVAINDMTCSRTKASYLLTECLAVHAHENLIQELQDAKGFSFLCDKATDNTMRKIFCINVRFVTNGAPKTHLYRLVRVEHGDAESLFNVLQECMDEDKLSWEKVIGYASDGENLMQGGLNSFLTRLRDKNRLAYMS